MAVGAESACPSAAETVTPSGLPAHGGDWKITANVEPGGDVVDEAIVAVGDAMKRLR